MVSHMMMINSARAPGVCNLRPEGLSRARCIMLRLAVYEAIPVGLDKLFSLSLPMSRTFFPELLSMTWLALNRLDIPLTECLKDTVARVLPFWNESMAPAIKAGKRIVVAAHGNSIRALVKYLDNISDDDIVGVNIPNGIPLVYTLDSNLKPMSKRYLGDAAAAAAASAAVASQGKA